MKISVLVISFIALAAGQRPSFAGHRPIGYPEYTTVTEAGLGDRFGEVNGTTSTTQRLPVEANGDRDLVDRLSKLPIDQQPFWFINWQAIEANQNRPQTYPQRPNQFVDDLSNSNRPQTYPQKPNGFVDDLSNQGSSANNQNSNFNNNNPNLPNNNPNFSNNNPNFANNNPNFANNNPNFANNNPNFANNNPNFATNNPNFANNYPNFATNNPNFANNNPNFANNNPNFVNNNPNFANNNPNFANNNPNFVNRNPNFANINPNFANRNPNFNNINPNFPNRNGVNSNGLINRFGEDSKPSNSGNNMVSNFGAHNIQIDKVNPPTTQKPSTTTYKSQYYYQ